MHNLGIGGGTPSPPQPAVASGGVGVGSGGEGELPPTQAPTPRRVPYYTAAFVKTATLAEVCKTHNLMNVVKDRRQTFGKGSIILLIICAQVSEKIQQMLHVKSEDLRLYDLTHDENAPKLLEDETQTIQEMFDTTQKPASKESLKLLIESMWNVVVTCSAPIHTPLYTHITLTGAHLPLIGTIGPTVFPR